MNNIILKNFSLSWDILKGGAFDHTQISLFFLKELEGFGEKVLSLFFFFFLVGYFQMRKSHFFGMAMSYTNVSHTRYSVNHIDVFKIFFEN